jgi:hypothetical protein
VASPTKKLSFSPVKAGLQTVGKIYTNNANGFQNKLIHNLQAREKRGAFWKLIISR